MCTVCKNVILGCAWHTFLFLGFAFEGFLFAAATAAVGSFRHGDAVHAPVLKIAVYFWLILLALRDTNKTIRQQNQHLAISELQAVQTDERFRLRLNPPSLILRGATFLVFTLFFFSCGFDAVFDFFRALGPANTNTERQSIENVTLKSHMTSYEVQWKLQNAPCRKKKTRK